MSEIAELKVMRGGIKASDVGASLDYAMALIAGWPNKERSAITELLEELRPLAKHNAEIYQQASAALKRLSTKDAESRRLQDAAEKARDETKGLQEKASAEIAQADAKQTGRRSTLSTARSPRPSQSARRQSRRARQIRTPARQRSIRPPIRPTLSSKPPIRPWPVSRRVREKPRPRSASCARPSHDRRGHPQPPGRAPDLAAVVE